MILLSLFLFIMGVCYISLGRCKELISIALVYWLGIAILFLTYLIIDELKKPKGSSATPESISSPLDWDGQAYTIA